MFFYYYCYAFLKYLCILCLIQISIGMELVHNRTDKTLHTSGSSGEQQMEDDITKLSWKVYCKLQPNRNKCGAHHRNVRKYFYDIKLNDCEQFNFGNCKDSYNVFDGRHECISQCRDEAPHPAPTNLSENIFCRFQPDFGNCNSYYPMFYFDVAGLHCRGFSYSGCGGNANRFPNAQVCAAVCGAVIKAPEN